jgi:phosphoglycerol transferase MdoB-like AlkP superfamily enzyme
VIRELASQIDIAPTLLGILNMSYLSCFFGHDVLLSPPERALIANYQNLGLYNGKQLAILKPQEKIALQDGFRSQQVREQIAGKNTPLVQRDISYYQSAAYIYKNRINRWSSRHMVTIHTAVTE